MEEEIDLNTVWVSYHVMDRYRKYLTQRREKKIDLDQSGFRASLRQSKTLPITKLRNWREKKRKHPNSVYYYLEPDNLVFAVDVENKTVATCFPFVGKGAAGRKPKARDSRAREKREVRKMIEGVTSSRM